MNKNILSPEEESRLQIFIGDPIMQQAVQKVLLYDIYGCGVLKSGEEIEKTNAAFNCLRDATGKDRSNEEAGKLLRIIVEASVIVERAFNEIKTFKKSETIVLPKVNEAR